MSSSKKQNTTADSKTSWYKTADTTRNVLEFLASTSDLLSCDRVCKLWKEQSMPLPKVVIRPSHTAHVAWLRNNLKRVKELDLVAVESSTDYCLWPSEVASQLYKALQAHTISFGSLQLRTFPESSLGGLSNLLQLKLDRCLQLVELPYGQLSKLTSLQSLVLEHCHGLSTITGGSSGSPMAACLSISRRETSLPHSASKPLVMTLTARNAAAQYRGACYSCCPLTVSVIQSG